MDPQVQASFIPKKSLDISASRSRGTFGLFTLIALLVFIASIVAAGASFAYTRYLNSAIASKSQSLTLAEGAFDPSVIQDLLRLDNRLNQSKQLLANHVAVSGIFALLAAQTIGQVSFNSFQYTLNSDGTAGITMSGVANSFATVALQSDQFSADTMLKNVVFSGITVEPNGQVSFTVTADADPSVISYSNTLNASNSATPILPAPSTPATTTTPVTPPTQ
jgi:hypothetical protein